MAIKKNAKKAIRASLRKQVFNARRKTAMREALRDARRALVAERGEEMAGLLPKAYQAIDKAAKRGVIKPNNASRKKSRLAAAIARAGR